jgi:predicted glycogen debranching enzyme
MLLVQLPLCKLLAMLQKNKNTMQQYEKAIQYEWLETNGLGGWSSSTIIGCNTRRYHGVLVAATVPPVERMNLVSKLDETILAGDQRFELGSNDYGDVVAPNGNQYMNSFTKGLFPEWVFEVPGVRLKKTIAMTHGKNTTLIVYSVLKAEQPFTLQLLPLLSVRGYHSLVRQNNAAHWDAEFLSGVFKTRLYDGSPEIFIKVPGAQYHYNPCWYLHFNYSMEKYRGLDFVEDLFSHGIFSMLLQEGDEWGIIVSTEDPEQKDALELLQTERGRRENVLHQPFNAFALQQLTLAADQFIVKREEDLKTVIAGYHWFTDWGRDTMISLPGLTLHTGRYEDAKKILSAFARSVSMGMLPNRFGDNDGEPEYNNADGTLWYFIAVYKYLHATNDRTFVLGEILPVLKEIIDWHFKGTRYHIHVTEDGLLHAGESGQQLTWMDAKIGNWVVTPRMGKPVEIQALWYNALRIFSELLKLNNQQQDARLVDLSADKTKSSFLQLFWNASGNYLYDLIDEQGNPDPSVRPNQIFSISLPFALMVGEQAKAILAMVTKKLYTPVGLRSLSPDDPWYIGIYAGDPVKRDSSYHQGTVWSWLLGPYVDAIVRLEDSSWNAQQVINNFKFHLGEACLGSVSEIFDGEPPHHPRGCIAQAWSVAEILRVVKEYGLY